MVGADHPAAGAGLPVDGAGLVEVVILAAAVQGEAGRNVFIL